MGSVIEINRVMQRMRLNLLVVTLRRKNHPQKSEFNEIKAQLRNQHGSLYSGVQYTMWAKMNVAGSHESLEDPPQCPLFGAKRSRGQSYNLAVTLSDLAGKLVNAVSPD